MVPAVNSVTPNFAGFAFAFGGQNDSTATTFLGTTDFASVGGSSAFWFFQYTFSATSVTIVAGTLAERCQMAGMYVVSLPPTASFALSCFGQELTIIFLPFFVRCFSVSVLFRCTGWICLPCGGPRHLVQQWLFEYHERQPAPQYWCCGFCWIGCRPHYWRNNRLVSHFDSWTSSW